MVARPIAGGYHIEYKGEQYEILSDWQLGQSLFRGSCNGEEFTLQVERHRTKYSLFHRGARADFMVSERPRRRAAGADARETRTRPFEVPMSPMPGLLRDALRSRSARRRRLANPLRSSRP